MCSGAENCYFQKSAGHRLFLAVHRILLQFVTLLFYFLLFPFIVCM